MIVMVVSMVLCCGGDECGVCCGSMNVELCRGVDSGVSTVCITTAPPPQK